MDAANACCADACRGMWLAVRGYSLVVARRRLLAHFVVSVLRTMAATCVVAAAMWVLLLLPRSVGLISCSYAQSVRRVASAMLFVSQLLTPTSFRGLFFLALEDADAAIAQRLGSQALVRGLGATLLSHALHLLGGAVALAAFCASLPLWLPAFFASALALIYAAPLLLLALLPLALAITAFFATGLPRKLAPALFSTVGSPALALLAVASWLVSWWVLDVAVRAACTWLLCGAFAQQSLSQYAARRSTREWTAWTRARPWLLAGFGLPGCLAVRHAHPLVGLAVLELTQGAAATLLAAEEARAERPGGGGGAAGSKND